jgi:hypothetical protein
MGEARWRARGRGNVAAGIDQAPAQPAHRRPQLWRSPGRRHLDEQPAKPVRSTSAWGGPCGPARPCNRVARQPAARARRDVAARRRPGSSRGRAFGVPLAGQPRCGRSGNRGGRETAANGLAARLEVTRRCRWRRCGGRGVRWRRRRLQWEMQRPRRGCWAGTRGNGAGLLLVRPSPDRGAGRVRSHSRGNWPPTSRAAGVGRAAALAGRPWEPPCGDGQARGAPAG